MKIKLDYDYETEIPKVIEKEYKKSSSDCEFKEWFDDEWYKLISEYSNKLCDKELARFLIDWHTEQASFYGGYPKEWENTFEDKGFKYTSCCFGWTGDLEADCKNNNFHILSYKEKKKKK